VLPRIGSIEAAAQLVKGAKIPANNKISLTNPPPSKKYKSAWPMSTFTYVIVPTSSPKAAQIKAFIKFALSAPAQKAIQPYVFAPMPSSVIAAAKKTLASIH
jgi:ABC-type phosphate transport system substrate-binding protein